MLFTQFIKRYKRMLKTKQRGWKDLGNRDKVFLLCVFFLIGSSISLVVFTLLNAFSENHKYNCWVIGTGLASVVLATICWFIIFIKKYKDNVIQTTYQKRVEAIQEIYIEDYRNLDYRRFLLWVREESNKKITKQTNILEKASFGYVIGFMAPVLNLVFPNGMQFAVVFLSALLLFAAVAVFRIQIMDHYELYKDLSDVMSYYLISDYLMMKIYSVSINGDEAICSVKRVQS